MNLSQAQIISQANTILEVISMPLSASVINSFQRKEANLVCWCFAVIKGDLLHCQQQQLVSEVTLSLNILQLRIKLIFSDQGETI